MKETGGTVSKEARQQAIGELLDESPVRTQAELIERLGGRSITVDQSTLSRDFAELDVRKRRGRYVRSDAEEPNTFEIDNSVAVKWFATCGPHQIVIKTEIGQAQPVAIQIEREDEPTIVAVLAGDDTLFLATKTRRTQTVALRRLEQWFGDKHEH
jgi:transcriptional regulator of arginine metabolism